MEMLQALYELALELDFNGKDSTAVYADIAILEEALELDKVAA